jgi:uncharacterized membrane protein
MAASSVGLAFALIELDSAVLGQAVNQWPRAFGVGANGARQMLSTLAGSMITVMGITFSMTLLALTLASGQYTPRVLRNFMRSRVTQTTLGIFASIFVYCLIVLRTVRSDSAGEEFVPRLAVFVALIMSVTGVAVLIYFIHHIASSIQASNVIASVARETQLAIDRYLREPSASLAGKDGSHKEADDSTRAHWVPVPAAHNGYILSVDFGSLQTLVVAEDTVVWMQYGVGQFVVRNTPLLLLSLRQMPEEGLMKACNQAFDIGSHRTVEQDPAFGIQQIVDIALKALSPGINDTSTAIICVDHLTAILAGLAERRLPPKQVFVRAQLRVIKATPSFEDFLCTALDAIRRSGAGNISILLSLLHAVESIGSLSIDLSYLDALERQRQHISELPDIGTASACDRVRLAQQLSCVRESLLFRAALSLQIGPPAPTASIVHSLSRHSRP